MSPFDLNWRHLRALGPIVAHRSLNRAAETAGLSQPALTQGLGKIEQQLQVRLFDRTPGGMAPTPAGLALAERADRAFAALGNVKYRRTNRAFARPDTLITATQAEAFLHFANAGSFAGGAVAGGLSQPAVHRAVRELEQIWGAPLAERRGRGMVLTTVGQALARGIRLAAGEIAAGVAEARGDIGDGERIAIGAMPLSRALLLPRALAMLLEEAPGATVDVVEGSWRELIEPLLDGVIDMMIGALRPDPPPGIDQAPLFADRLAVFGRAGHPLAGKPVTRGDYVPQHWVVGPKGTPLRAHWEALFEGSPLPAVPVECGSVMVIRGLLHQSDLLTLLSPDQVALEVEAGMLAQIGPDLPDTVRIIGISTRSGWQPMKAQALLIDLLGRAAQNTRLQESL